MKLITSQVFNLILIKGSVKMVYVQQIELLPVRFNWALLHNAAIASVKKNTAEDDMEQAYGELSQALLNVLSLPNEVKILILFRAE